MKIRLADYVAEKCSALGLEQVFMVTGGGAMHLNDALGRQKNLKTVHCHHEQACSMAADAYFRVCGKPAIVNVTTGPGGTNALTGVYGAYTDSIGMVVISGQVKRETLVHNTGLNLRQLGDQEVDIVRMTQSITKMAEVVEDPALIRYQLEKALFVAQEGRPGPVWLDIPIDVQGAQIDPETLVGFTPTNSQTTGNERWRKNTEQLFKALQIAKRPVIMAGGGVRISQSHPLFIDFIETLQIPVTTCWNAHDVLWSAHPLYVGRPGTIGDRAGNFSVQNADLVLVLGSRLNIRQISYNWQSFARNAVVAMVDIDDLELKKPTLSIDIPIHVDLKNFFLYMKDLSKGYEPKHQEYLDWCRERSEKYPTVLPEYWENTESVNPYCFAKTLTDHLEEEEIVVTGDGTACVVTFQAATIKPGQRLFTNSGCAAMGFDLPAAIGAWFGSKKERIICIAGDGSMMMNLQELQTIYHYKIPIKLFVLNNQGYHSIRQTQKNYFPDNIVGCGTESGLSFPSLQKLAATFGFEYSKISNHSELKQQIDITLNSRHPVLCEVILDLNQQFSPKLSSRRLSDGRMVSSPLEDMAPFLDRKELKGNMIDSTTKLETNRG